MSRIKVRYYKAHLPVKERELSPAAYIVWQGMTTEQREIIVQYGKDMTKALQNLAVVVSTALYKSFKNAQPALQKEIERIKSANSL